MQGDGWERDGYEEDEEECYSDDDCSEGRCNAEDVCLSNCKEGEMCPTVCTGWCVKKTEGGKEDYNGKEDTGKEDYGKGDYGKEDDGKENDGGKKEDGWYQDSNGEWVYGSKEDDSGSKGDTGKVCKEEWEQNSDGDWVNCYTGEVWKGGK